MRLPAAVLAALALATAAAGAWAAPPEPAPSRRDAVRSAARPEAAERPETTGQPEAAEAAAPPAEIEPEPAPAPPPPGAVEGVVRHAGRTPLRVKVLTNTVDVETCGASVRSQALVLGRNGALGNVVVELWPSEEPDPERDPEDRTAERPAPEPDGGPWTAGAQTLEVALRACAAQPHVAIVAPGTRIEVVNVDHLHHELVTRAVRNVVWEQRLPRYARRVAVPARAVARPEAVQLSCERHPFVSAWWWITDNPRHVLTTDDGLFRLAGVPPGRWVLHAWHEELGEVEATVDVPPGGVAKVDLVYK